MNRRTNTKSPALCRGMKAMSDPITTAIERLRDFVRRYGTREEWRLFLLLERRLRDLEERVIELTGGKDG